MQAPIRAPQHIGTITIGISHINTFHLAHTSKDIIGGVKWSAIAKPNLKWCKSTSPTAALPLYGKISISVMVECNPVVEVEQQLPEDWVVPAKVTLIARSSKPTISDHVEVFQFDFCKKKNIIGNPYFMDKDVLGLIDPNHGKFQDIVQSFTSKKFEHLNYFELIAMIEAEEMTSLSELEVNNKKKLDQKSVKFESSGEQVLTAKL